MKFILWIIGTLCLLYRRYSLGFYNLLLHVNMHVETAEIYEAFTSSDQVMTLCEL